MKRFYFLSCFLLIVLGASAQTGFQNSFGDTTADRGSAIIKTRYGKYCIVGTTYHHTGDSTEITLYYVYPNGDLYTSSRLGLPGNDFVTSVVEAKDGNVILTGYSYESPLGGGNADIFVAKVDSIDGFLIWSKFYGGISDDIANSIIMTPDSNYLIGGSTESFGTTSKAALAMKIDNDGNLIWSKTVDLGFPASFNSATISLDTNYILCGDVQDGNGSDHLITRMLSDGTIVWSRKLGSSHSEFSNSITASSDSAFVIAGTLIDSITGDADQLLTKIYSNGSQFWSVRYSSPREDRLTSVIQIPNGNYVTCGYTNTDSTGVTIFHTTISETDLRGNPIWTYTYGYSPEPSVGLSIIPAIDSGYACVGTTYATGDLLGDASLVKTDTSGFTSCDEYPVYFSVDSFFMALSANFIDTYISPDTLSFDINYTNFSDQFVSMCYWTNVPSPNAFNNISLYPNPASESITLSGELGNSVVSVINPVGQTIESLKVKGNILTLNTSSYQAGMYFVRIHDGHKSTVHKFIIQ